MILDMPTGQSMVIRQTMMIKKFAKVFLIIDFGVIVFCVLSNNYLWLINTQVAFISSMLISIATFLSYKRNVDKRLAGAENLEDLKDDRDKIDQIDDPFDLYSESKIDNEKTDYTPEQIKQILKEEKQKVKQNSFKNAFSGASGFVSLYRVLAYAFLVFGFFSLTNNEIFHTMAYLTGLFIVPLSMFFMKLILK